MLLQVRVLLFSFLIRDPVRDPVMGRSVEPLGFQGNSSRGFNSSACCLSLIKVLISASSGLIHFNLQPLYKYFPEMSQILHLAAASGQKPLDVTSG